MALFQRRLLPVAVLLAAAGLIWAPMTGGAGHAIPDISGKILTVRGPVDPAEVGPTIMHEHVLLDYRGKPKEGLTATEAAYYKEPVSLRNLSRLRSWISPNEDNMLLGDVDVAIREVLEFKRWGGSGIVDCTSIGLGRDPTGLLQVSNATGLHIVMGAGWYIHSFHPEDMGSRTVEELTEIIIKDITVGAEGTAVPSGIIGEVGVGTALNPNELKSTRAAARASRATGAAISFHHAGRGEGKFTVLDMVEAEGADLNRVIIGHSNHIATQIPYMKRLLERGVYIQFDLMGEVIPRLGRIHDYDTVRSIVQLIRDGYADRLLLSQDVCTKTMMKTYGGMGFSFVMEFVLPELRRLGAPEEALHQIMVENPRRVLTFAKPG